MFDHESLVISAHCKCIFMIFLFLFQLMAMCTDQYWIPLGSFCLGWGGALHSCLFGKWTDIIFAHHLTHALLLYCNLLDLCSYCTWYCELPIVLSINEDSPIFFLGFIAQSCQLFSKHCTCTCTLPLKSFFQFERFASCINLQIMFELFIIELEWLFMSCESVILFLFDPQWYLLFEVLWRACQWERRTEYWYFRESSGDDFSVGLAEIDERIIESYILRHGNGIWITAL